MNNNKIAKFKTVSYEQFEKDMIDTFDGFYSKDEIAGIYETIKLPRRATTGSAGYDFFTHIPFDLEPMELGVWVSEMLAHFKDAKVPPIVMCESLHGILGTGTTVSPTLKVPVGSKTTFATHS